MYFFQYVKELIQHKADCGGYRSRTDDLFGASEAL
jgi:hypothetical protein